MSVPNRKTLVQSGSSFPKPASVKQFVTELLNNWPSGGAGPSLPSGTVIQVNTVMIGNNLRIQATPQGGVLQVLGTDTVWHTQLSWGPTKPTGT